MIGERESKKVVDLKEGEVKRTNDPVEFCKYYKSQAVSIDESILTIQKATVYDVNSNRFFPNLDKKSPGDFVGACLAEVYFVSGEMKHMIYVITHTEDGEIFVMLHDIEDQWLLEKMKAMGKDLDKISAEEKRRKEQAEAQNIPDTEREIPYDEVQN
jgi:hypothetical protein